MGGWDRPKLNSCVCSRQDPFSLSVSNGFRRCWIRKGNENFENKEFSAEGRLRTKIKFLLGYFVKDIGDR